MANNYLDDLLGKISAYDLFNVLLPGALVTYSVSQMPLGSCIDCSNWLALFVMSYVLGLIASRIGSLCALNRWSANYNRPESGTILPLHMLRNAIQRSSSS